MPDQHQTGSRPISRSAQAIRHLHRRVIYPVLNFILPSSCGVCGERLGHLQHEGVCSACWTGIDLLRPPLCPGCRHPVADGTDPRGPAAGRCAACVTNPLGFDEVCVVAPYEGVARKVILKAKLGGYSDLFRSLGIRMARLLEISGLAPRCHILVPVPSHPLSVIRRGFNPALELSRPISDRLRIPIGKNILRRRLAHPERTLRSAAGRRRIDQELAITTGRGRLPRGTVLLVDDILTSGATVRACAAVLRRAGADSLALATWARALRQH